MEATARRSEGLLDWQRSHYPEAHRNRRNLAIHAATVPLFLLGGVAVVLAIAFAWWLAPAGIATMIAAIAMQGRGHARERARPAPFRGALDAVARIVAEQWVTFPRFVLSGEFAAAWRAAKP